MSEPVQTEYEYIYFLEVERKPKTAVYSCRNIRSDGELGVVKWYGAWRQYCYFPTVQAVYSAGCLADIEAFISQLMAQRGAVPA